jgi:hypothetical protein
MPAVVPKKSDFAEGQRLLDRSFPVDWQHAEADDIVLPEEFEPHSPRE